MSSVLFVCLGNICRSPTAEGVFRVMASKQGVAVSTDSCGTAGWHQGNPPDPRSKAAAKAAGYPIDDLRARQITLADFDRFDRVVAMDRQNLADLSALQPAGSRAELSLFLDFCDEPQDQVPDPYYGGDDGFAEVIRLVELASHGLLQALQSKS